MESRLDDVTKLRVVFLTDKVPASVDFNDTAAPGGIYIGQTVKIALVAEFIGKRGENNKDVDAWQSRAKQLSVHACLIPEQTPVETSEDGQSSGRHFGGDTNCPICSSFVEGSENNCICDMTMGEKSSFVSDVCWTQHVNLTLNALPGSCPSVCLCVTTWIGDTPPNRPLGQLDMVLEPNQSIILDDKIITKAQLSCHLAVIPPPTVDATIVTLAGKHAIMVKVRNQNGETVSVFRCGLVLQSDQETSSQPRETTNNDSQKNIGSKDESLDSYISVSSSMKSPVVLQPCEQYSLLCHLRPQSSRVERLTELYLAARITWGFKSRPNHKRIATTYLLPKICLKRPPFLVCTSSRFSTEPRRSFAVTYDISNRLQDFLALKLYWSPEKALANTADTETRRGLEKLVRSVVCHDPSVELGTSPRNTSMSVKVGFQVLQPGLFELGTHMKLNLRYALGNHSNLASPSLLSPSVTNSDSTTTLSADDQLAKESANLWRDRSASICSSQSAEQDAQLVTDRRRSFATKSYSFGDLGPTGSSGDSTEDPPKVRFKKMERSSAVPPPQPPSRLPLTPSATPDASHATPKNLMDPGHFLKKPCFVYVPAT